MIKEITVKNFRSIRELKRFKLKKLNVLIGPNASGKSNFMEIFRFFKNAGNRKFQEYISKQGGLKELSWNKLHEPISFQIGISLKISERLSFFHFSIEMRSLDNWIEELREPEVHDFPLFRHLRGSGIKAYDEVNQKQIRIVSGLELAQADLALTSLTQPYFNKVHSVASEMKKWEVYHYLDTSYKSEMRQAIYVDPEITLAEGGDNLASVLHNFFNESEYKDTKDEIMDICRAAYPDFEDIGFPSGGGQGKIILSWKEKNKKAFTANHISDGILRFLCLVSILVNPKPPPLICIDEPETGLHPTLIKMIAELIQDASMRTQVIVTTHSPQLVNCFKPEDVVVVEKDEKGTRLNRLSNAKLKDWLKTFELGELWLQGELGGKP